MRKEKRAAEFIANIELTFQNDGRKTGNRVKNITKNWLSKQ
jgi:hypothetical protein